jgi:putative NIF3 family GTP cyclohydrolase 1 type 2
MVVRGNTVAAVAARDEIIGFCDELLDSASFDDYGPNGLQVPGAGEVTKVATGVTANLALAAYHLPLDAHPEIGNNALLRDALGLEADGRPFGEAKGATIGVIGRSSEPIGVDELRRRLADAVGQDPLVFDAGPDRIETVGIVTGAGGFALHEAGPQGLDALVTGEPSEPVMGEAREYGIHFLAGGHYATETLGIRRLGELVAERFAIAQEFIDVPNPV